MSSRQYDLILEDGGLFMDVGLEPGCDHYRNQPIAARLPLDLWHRLPFVGLVLRNFWAKRKGAILCEIPDPP